MKCREPNRADLIDTRLARIDETTANLKVRFGVTPVQDIAALKGPKRKCGYEQSQRQCNRRYLASRGRRWFRKL